MYEHQVDMVIIPTRKKSMSFSRRLFRPKTNVSALQKFAIVSRRPRRTSGGRRKQTSLLLHGRHKDTIAPVPLYDNGLASVLLFEARAGALRALLRKQAYDSELMSVVRCACSGADETIAHIVTKCTQLSPSNVNTDLAAALGFVGADGMVDYATVRCSKTRL